LTVTGPYSYTRNPLYLGSAVMAAGAVWAMQSWISAAVLFVYFTVVYYVVMRREEGELRGHFGAAFEEYAGRVPLFFPRLMAAKGNQEEAGAFSYAQYRRNHEHQAVLGFLALLAFLFLVWWLRQR